MKSEKIKLSELKGRMPKVEVDKMKKITGGGVEKVVLEDGCHHGICSIKINPDYCEGGAICTSGIA